MDTRRFDRLALAMAQENTRRGALRLLAGGFTAGLLARRVPESAGAAQLPGCVAPRTMCSGYCVDLATNPFHCGACFNFCERSPLPDGTTACLAGVCTSVDQNWPG